MQARDESSRHHHENDETSNHEKDFIGVIGCLKAFNLKCCRMIENLISNNIASNPLSLLHSTVTQCEKISSYALEIVNCVTETIENVESSMSTADVETESFALDSSNLKLLHDPASRSSRLSKLEKKASNELWS